MTRGGECIGDDHTVHVHSVDFQNVEFHVGQLGELPQTELTRVRPLARVTQHVSAQFGRSDEPFAAKIALMFVMWGQGYTVLVILRGGHLDNDRDQCGYGTSVGSLLVTRTAQAQFHLRGITPSNIL